MQNGLAAFAALVIFAMAALLSASLIIVLRPFAPALRVGAAQPPLIA